MRPRGYRSPAWDFSDNTIDLLLEFGFDYDSSCMGNDVYPYYLRQGDQASPTEPYVFGQPVDLVEVPVTWGLDDFPPFEFVWGMNPGLTSPSDIEEIWRGDFDYAYRHAQGAVYALTMHPQVIGRGHRMLMLERLLTLSGHDGVAFETISTYSPVEAVNPLAAGRPSIPYPTWDARPLNRRQRYRPANRTPGSRSVGRRPSLLAQGGAVRPSSRGARAAATAFFRAMPDASTPRSEWP